MATIHHAGVVRGKPGENMRDGKVIGVKVETNILQMTGHIRIVSAVERGFELENHWIRVISGLQGRVIVALEYEGGKGERGRERRAERGTKI